METNSDWLNDILFNDIGLFMKVYGDESGKHLGADTLSICALLIKGKAHKLLDKRWRIEAAKTPQIPLPFHMSDCVAGTKSFAHLACDVDVRESMQRRMIRQMKGLDIEGSACVIKRAELEKYGERILVSENKTYGTWLHAFPLLILRLLLKTGDDPLDLVFDRNDKEIREKAHEMFDRILTFKDRLPAVNRLKGLSFVPKDDIVGLQAADIVVN